MDIPLRVKKLVEKWGTSNPFSLCNYLGIIVSYKDLGNLKGYSMKKFRRKYICINENLNEVDRLFTCAHELGHLMCNHFDNLNFLLNNTYLVNISVYEDEANLFAKELLKDNETWCTTSQIDKKYWDIFYK